MAERSDATGHGRAPCKQRREEFPRGDFHTLTPSPPQHADSESHVNRGGEGAGNVWAIL